MSSFKNLEDHLQIKTNNKIRLNGLHFCAPLAAFFGHAMHSGFDSMLGRAMQLGVTSSAHFASSAPRGNRSWVASSWQLSHATCNGAIQL